MEPSSSAEQTAELSIKDVMKAGIKLLHHATGLKTHKSQPGDVLIATFPKSGTTLLQNMTYGLVVEAGGAPSSDPDGTNFKEMGEVVPFIEISPITGVTSCDSKPRLFKVHASANHFNLSDTGIKYIYCFRDPRDIPGSYLDFSVGWSNPGIQLTTEDRKRLYHQYVRNVFLARGTDDAQSGGRGAVPQNVAAPGTWFDHVAGWTEKKRSNVLVLQYEKIIEDLYGTAEIIARFLGLEVSTASLEKVVAKCDRATMAKDPRFRELMLSKALGWSLEGGVKVRLKGSGGFRDIKFDAEEEEILRQYMMQIFGVEDYNAFSQKIEELHRDK